MSANFSEKESAIRQQVEHSEIALLQLKQDLQAADSELVELAQRKQQYDVLSQACQSLQELDDLDATHLFWGKYEKSAGHLGNVRRQIDEFQQELATAKQRRQSIVDNIGNQNDDLDDLHYDLDGIIAQEQRRQNNWVVEREPTDWPFRAVTMPWARGFEEDRRFRRSLVGSMLATFAIAVLVGTVAIPVKERSKVSELPERVAKLVREQRVPPPPEPVEEPVQPEELSIPEPEPEPELVQEQPPVPTEEPVVAEVRQPDTREQVKAKGILAFRDSFANRANLRPNAQLGSRAKLSSAGENAVSRPERSMVSTSAPGSSGGINLASISRDVGGGAGGQGLEGVQVSRVASSIGGGGGADRPRSGGVSAGRTDEEIQIVFDRYKAALYRLYNRELRKNPTLRGQLVLRLTIEPDGSVSLCQLQDSNMGAPALAEQIVNRIQTFDFGAKQDIVAMTIIYPIDFLPAA